MLLSTITCPHGVGSRRLLVLVPWFGLDCLIKLYAIPTTNFVQSRLKVKLHIIAAVWIVIQRDSKREQGVFMIVMSNDAISSHQVGYSK